MGRVDRNNWLVATIMHHIQHYNPDTYWKMRDVVIFFGRGRNAA